MPRYTGGLWVGKFIKKCTYQKVKREASAAVGELRTFTFGPDPQFGENLLEVVALYMNRIVSGPRHCSFDESRLQPDRPG